MSIACSARSRDCLHAFTGVAELKQSRSALPTRLPVCLHAFTGVAELKQATLDALSEVFRKVSTPSPAWPN